MSCKCIQRIWDITSGADAQSCLLHRGTLTGPVGVPHKKSE